ncbi:unnamed protein product [Acanthosepion pharaonis]|uniref:Uncharacterized protein n=1 Tax=Acanthosepion pharaonis TaxID=158019 RepID=A0A812DZH1_ACAPH|nr:unnamed protein product [Sepia pharaonis]
MIPKWPTTKSIKLFFCRKQGVLVDRLPRWPRYISLFRKRPPKLRLRRNEHNISRCLPYLPVSIFSGSKLLRFSASHRFSSTVLFLFSFTFFFILHFLFFFLSFVFSFTLDLAFPVFCMRKFNAFLCIANVFHVFSQIMHYSPFFFLTLIEYNIKTSSLSLGYFFFSLLFFLSFLSSSFLVH